MPVCLAVMLEFTQNVQAIVLLEQLSAIAISDGGDDIGQPEAINVIYNGQTQLLCGRCPLLSMFVFGVRHHNNRRRKAANKMSEPEAMRSYPCNMIERIASATWPSEFKLVIPYRELI